MVHLIEEQKNLPATNVKEYYFFVFKIDIKEIGVNSWPTTNCKFKI